MAMPSIFDVQLGRRYGILIFVEPGMLLRKAELEHFLAEARSRLDDFLPSEPEVSLTVFLPASHSAHACEQMAKIAAQMHGLSPRVSCLLTSTDFLEARRLLLDDQAKPSDQRTIWLLVCDHSIVPYIKAIRGDDSGKQQTVLISIGATSISPLRPVANWFLSALQPKTG